MGEFLRAKKTQRELRASTSPPPFPPSTRLTPHSSLLTAISTLLKQLHHRTTSADAMSLLEVNTVDRLDRPSAYYAGKVRISALVPWLDAIVLTGILGTEQETQRRPGGARARA